MYPFEQEIGRFKRMVKNRAKVEGSICQAYISKETSNFCSYYFELHLQSGRTKVTQNDDGGESLIESTFFLFNQPDQATGRWKDRRLTGSEWKSRHLYILLNCDEVESFRR